jgi:flagellar biogenesis protein FliO
MAINTTPAGWQSGLKSALGPWANVVIVAGLAIVLGVMLPKLLSSEPVVDEKKKDNPQTTAKGTIGSDYKTPALPEINPQALLGKLFMGTIVVLGLSVGSIWMMKRWLPAQGPAGSVQREMRLIETLHLGHRTSLHLVHLGKREVLIGTDAGGIKSIVPLARPFEDALAETEASEAAAEDSLKLNAA